MGGDRVGRQPHGRGANGCLRTRAIATSPSSTPSCRCPTALARSLARPEQTPWRSLAGVGAALWSGTGHWIYGYLFALLVSIVALLAISALVQAAGLLLDTGWNLQTGDGGWNTMFT